MCQYLILSTISTEWLSIDTGTTATSCLVRLMTNSLVLFIFNISALFLHQPKSSTYFIYSTDSFISFFWRSPTKAISSAYLKSLKLKSLIYSENTGDMTLPWGAPVLTVRISDSWPVQCAQCSYCKFIISFRCSIHTENMYTWAQYAYYTLKKYCKSYGNKKSCKGKNETHIMVCFTSPTSKFIGQIHSS